MKYDELMKKFYPGNVIHKSHGIKIEDVGFYVNELKKDSVDTVVEGYESLTPIGIGWQNENAVDDTEAAKIMKEYYEYQEQNAFKWFLEGIARSMEKEDEKKRKIVEGAMLEHELDDMVGKMEELGAGNGAALHYKWHDSLSWEEQKRYLPRKTIHGKKMENSVKVLVDKQKEIDKKKAADELKRLKEIVEE